MAITSVRRDKASIAVLRVFSYWCECRGILQRRRPQLQRLKARQSIRA